MEKDMDYYVSISGSVIEKNCERRKELVSLMADQYFKSGKTKLCLIASGSSLNASLTALDFIEKYSGTKILIMSPSTYLDYKSDQTKDCFTVFISQSGCSTNIIEAMKFRKNRNQECILLTGNTQADAAKLADLTVEYGVGNETIDFVTLGFTTLVEYLMLLAMELGIRSGALSEELYQRLLEDIKKAGAASSRIYEQSVIHTKTYFETFLHMKKAIIVADGANMGTAREAALKFQETLRIPAVYYESEEYIHGPNMQLTPEYAVFFIDTNPGSNRMQQIYEATGRVTEHIFMITDKILQEEAADDRYISCPAGIIHELTPLYTVVPFQHMTAVVTKEKNGFKCHPLFDEFEKVIHCKTDDYQEIMEKKKHM